MKGNLLCCLLVVFWLAAGVIHAAGDEPDFCMGYECPEYEVVRSSDAFEIRRYQQTRWMSVRFTFSDGIPIKDAYLQSLIKGTKILTDYRTGQNDQKVEMNLTFPFRVTLTQSDFNHMEFVTAYYLPHDFQLNPPKPLDHQIFMEDFPALTVAASAYQHAPTKWDIADKAWKELQRKLKDEGIDFMKSSMDVLIYDHKAKHNEVAILLPNPPTANDEGELVPPRASTPGDHPDFCGERDCPDYEVKRSTRTYEIRQYAEAKWAIVNITARGTLDDAYKESLKVAFPLIYNYRKKGNEEQVELAHTLPMLVGHNRTDSSPANANDWTTFYFMYFIPYQFQDKVPNPNDKRIHIASLGPVSLAVRSFGGYVTSLEAVQPELEKLKEDLDSHGEKFHDGLCGVAQYDPMFKIQDRHNEVALWIKDKDSADSDPFAEQPTADGMTTSQSQSEEQKPNDHPDFCGDRDCPDFEIKRSTRTYEIRKYSSARWAVVNVTAEGTLDDAYKAALQVAFPVLFDYRKKGNNKEVELAHTLPMLVAYDQSFNSITDKTEFTFHFAYFIPYQFQDDVPHPNDKRIHIKCLGPASIAVRSFSGFISSFAQNVEPELEKLKEDLNSHGEKFHDGLCGVAQYDPLFKIQDRHNEVALWIKDKDSAQSEITPFTEVPAPVTSLSVLPVPAKQEADKPNDHPDFCGDRDCPDYEVKRSTRTYEIRKYPAAHWALVNHTVKGALDTGYIKALKKAVPILLNYRKKGNAEKVEMAHTLPMLVAYDKSERDSKKETTFWFGYFIPFEYQDKVPDPNDNRVEIKKVKSMSLGVRVFSGFVTSLEHSVEPQLDKLKEDLKSHDEKFHEHICSVSQYDPLWKITDRHNEVALWIKDKEEAEDSTLPFLATRTPDAAQQPDEEKDEEKETQLPTRFVPPKFCQEHDCPEFKVSRSGHRFEVRDYKKAKWLSFSTTSEHPYVKDDDFKSVLAQAMELITSYNNGNNKDKVQIPMTVPVRVLLRERYGDHKRKTKYEVAFYVPVKFQKHPPKPLDDRLEIKELDAISVAARGFNQSSTDWSGVLLPQVDQLAVDLNKAGEHYERDHTIVSFYDYVQLSDAMKQQQAEVFQYSEIWFLVK